MQPSAEIHRNRQKYCCSRYYPSPKTPSAHGKGDSPLPGRPRPGRSPAPSVTGQIIGPGRREHGIIGSRRQIGLRTIYEHRPIFALDIRIPIVKCLAARIGDIVQLRPWIVLRGIKTPEIPDHAAAIAAGHDVRLIVVNKGRRTPPLGEIARGPGCLRPFVLIRIILVKIAQPVNIESGTQIAQTMHTKPTAS